MSNTEESNVVSLEAKSPFELRVDHGKHVPELDVRSALMTGDMGFMHSFTTGSTVDGPGVRIVGWLSGCQFRCLYCHNPDTWTMANGIPVPIERAKAQLTKYSHSLKIMKGGLTLSGGEPLVQHRFVVKLFTAAKAMGIHTTLDTNGSLGSRLSDEDLNCIDLVMLCLKAWDPELHLRVTGTSGDAARDFARRLGALKRPVWLRFVLVPGLTDDPQEVAQLAEFAAGLGNIQRVEVLPFHQMGAFKWKKLGLEYELDGVEAPSQNLVDRVIAQFQSVGLNAC